MDLLLVLQWTHRYNGVRFTVDRRDRSYARSLPMFAWSTARRSGSNLTAFRMLGPVFSVNAGMTIQPREKSTNTAGGHSHA